MELHPSNQQPMQSSSFGMQSAGPSNQQAPQRIGGLGISAAPYNQQASQGIGGLGALAVQTPPFGGFSPGMPFQEPPGGVPPEAYRSNYVPPPGGFPPGMAQAVQQPGVAQAVQQPGVAQAVLPYMGADRQQLTPQQQYQRAMSDIADRDRFRNQQPQPQPQQIRQEEPRMQASRYIQQLANRNRGGM